GGLLDPALTGTFLEHAEELLGAISADSVWDEALAAEPEPWCAVGADDLEAITATLADFADLKSPYLLGHSSGVGALAAKAGAIAGLSAEDCRMLLFAGRLHDLGRLSVPNTVWHKRGALNAAEWERVRLHAYHSERVLAASPL